MRACVYKAGFIPVAIDRTHDLAAASLFFQALFRRGPLSQHAFVMHGRRAVRQWHCEHGSATQEQANTIQCNLEAVAAELYSTCAILRGVIIRKRDRQIADPF